MAYTTADGPPALDATHAWAPSTATAASANPPPTLNDRQTDPPTLPWIKVVNIDGWRDLPEMEDNRAPRTAADGEIVYPTRRLGKTVVYECVARANTREAVAGRVTACLRGFGTDISNEGTMTVTPYAGIGGPTWTFKGRVIGLDPDAMWSYDPERPTGMYEWEFTVAIRMSDPHFYTGGTGYL